MGRVATGYNVRVDWLRANIQWIFSGIGVAAIAFVAATAKWYLAQRKVRRVRSEQRRPIRTLNATTWIGTAIDAEIAGILQYKQIIQYDIRAKLKQRGERVTGEVWVEADMKYRLSVAGRLEDSTFLFVEYCNLNSNSTDRGFVILKLDGTGNRLSGILLGRGMREASVAVVSVELQRVHAS